MEQKFDMAFSESSHNIYNAVYAVAHALHEMNLQQVDNQAVDNGKGASSHCLKVKFLLFAEVQMPRLKEIWNIFQNNRFLNVFP